MVGLIITRNPIYLGLILLWISVVTIALRLTGQAKADMMPLSPLRFGAIVIPVAALINAFSVRIGTNVILTLPPSMPIIGGPITLEALLYGALNGLVLTGLFAGFLVLNRALTVRALVGLIPRAYYPVAVIVSIAITFIPVTLKQFQRIREAQAIRGHRVRGIRSWLPLFLPLLMNGIEQALQLAEAMTARGFASGTQQEQSAATRTVVLVGLLSMGAGLVLQTVGQARFYGPLLTGLGAIIIVGVLTYLGRQHPRTSYRPAKMSAHDWVIVAGALIMVVTFLVPNPLLNRASLFYYPYPRLTLPEFSIGLGMTTWALLLPALILTLAQIGATPGDAE